MWEAMIIATQFFFLAISHVNEIVVSLQTTKTPNQIKP